ncbi:MAG: MFS transporter [Hyphomicrobiales bacterium]|nr:MFS transporter [Hyphomicrobiales bacterium]
MHDAAPVDDDRQFRRGPVTWYTYLLLGCFTYVISIQGNILPFLKAELDLSYAAVSLHTSAIAIGMLMVGSIGERVVRRFGRHSVFTAAGLVCSVAAVLLALATAAWASLGATLLFGLAGAFIPAILHAILSDIHGPRRDIAYTEANAVAYLFAIIAPVLTAVFVWIGWGWRPAILAISLMIVVIVASFVRYPMPVSAEVREGAAAPAPLAFWLFWAVLGLSVAAEFSILIWAPAYLEQVVGLSESSAALAAAAFFAGMFAARLSGSLLVRRFTTRRLFLASAATTFVGFAAYWGSAEPVASIVGLFVIGLGMALLFPLGLSFAMGVAGPAADRAGARIMLAPGLAILLSPPLLGDAADRAGMAVAQLATPVFMLLAVLVFFAGVAASRR